MSYLDSSKLGGFPGSAANTATAAAGVTADMSTFSSPFDNFLNYVPKEHEVAVRQALFNAIAFVVFLALGVGTYYVFIILEPFMMPLFWAILPLLLHISRAVIKIQL